MNVSPRHAGGQPPGRYRLLSGNVVPVPDEPVCDSSEEEVIPQRYSPLPNSADSSFTSLNTSLKSKRPMLSGSMRKGRESFQQLSPPFDAPFTRAVSSRSPAPGSRRKLRQSVSSRELPRVYAPSSPDSQLARSHSHRERLGRPQALDAFRFGDHDTASSAHGSPKAHAREQRAPATMSVASSRRYSIKRMKSGADSRRASRTPNRSHTPGAMPSGTSSRRMFLIVIFVCFLAMWLVYLGKMGESTRHLLMERAQTLSHTFHLDQQRNEQLQQVVQQVQETAAGTPLQHGDDDDMELLQRLREKQQASERQRRREAEQREQEQRAQSQRREAEPTDPPETESPPPPPRASPASLANRYRSRVAMELAAFYTLKGLEEKIARVDSLLANVGTKPRQLYSALSKTYGNVDGSFPALLDWIRESELPADTTAQAAAAQEAVTGRGRGRGVADGGGRGRGRGQQESATERPQEIKPSFHVDQQVTAAHDIAKGGSVIVGMGSPGVITEILSDEKLRVRFLGKFGDTTPVVLAVAADDVVVAPE